MRPDSFTDALRIAANFLDEGDNLVREVSVVLGGSVSPGDSVQRDLRNMADLLDMPINSDIKAWLDEQFAGLDHE